MGAFAYSHEVGTHSYKNEQDNVPDEVKQQRLNALMDLQEAISAEVQEEKVGKTLRVMLDREEDYYIGRTEFDSPEVDPEVLVHKDADMELGKIYSVQIEAAEPFELYGRKVVYSIGELLRFIFRIIRNKEIYPSYERYRIDSRTGRAPRPGDPRGGEHAGRVRANRGRQARR